VGAELKNTFCLTRGNQAFLSQHIGDLKNAEEYSAFREGIDHLCKLLDIEPDRVVCDLHPDYLSTQHAEKLGLPLFRAQHHEAHVASVLMEHGSIGDAVGVAFDGVGWGRDGTLWGGEFFCGSLLEGFRRLGHLASVPQPGGDLVIKQPWRMAIAHLWSALGMEEALSAARDAFPKLPNRDIETVIHQCASRLNAPETSSVGRLFDAVSAFLGICRSGTYEGQPAAELEGAADPAEQGYYEFTTQGSLLSAHSFWKQILADSRTSSPAACAMRFHRGLAKAVAQVAAHIANASGLDTVALSGGVFQNKTLCELCCAELRLLGLVPLLNRRVPPNDGGICYGQAALLYSLQRRET
jgi:hydrogenase maturation protein HypF